MWDRRSLERMLNRTTLHTHALDAGDRLCPWSSLNCKTDQHLKSASRSSHSQQPVIGRSEPDAPTMEEFKLLAETEKQTALRLQDEGLRAQFQEALRARDRLEAETRREIQAELRAQFRAHCVRARVEMESERVQAVEEACRNLKEKLQKEAEEARERTMRTMQEEKQERVRRCVQEAVRRVREECEMKAEREKRILQDRHEEKTSELHDRLQQLQDSLEQVCRERMQYEAEFKKVQASYRKFVDLTDSSLHSDYLLKLRRLGREPGLMDTATQTDKGCHS